MENVASTLIDRAIDHQPEPSANADRVADRIMESVGDGGEESPVTETPTANADQPVSAGTANNLDSRHTVFNPTIHVADSFGNPVKNSDGTFRRKPGRKKGANYGDNKTVKESNPIPPVENASPVSSPMNVEAKRVQANVAATAIVGTFLAAAQIAFGEEWEPSDDERKGLIDAYTEWFATMENPTVPAWVPPIVATAMFAVPKFSMPKTRERIAAIRAKLSGENFREPLPPIENNNPTPSEPGVPVSSPLPVPPVTGSVRVDPPASFTSPKNSKRIRTAKNGGEIFRDNPTLH